LTKYEVLISETASKEFSRPGNDEENRIREKLNELGKDPHNRSNRLDTKKLAGTKWLYCGLRVGKFRIIYFIDGRKIKVARIAVRSDVYSRLD